MTLEEQRDLSFYRSLAPLHEERGVWLVQHIETGRIFVKKELEVYDREVFRYLKEHPVRSMPRICFLAEDEERLIVIEEYINGRPLQEILDEKGILPPAYARKIAGQLCRILIELHGAEQPVIHRDIKPSNVLITDEDRVFLIDMNAAKKYRSGRFRDTRLIGTHGYAAPEQYGFGTSDVRTDIYSLGVLMNVMLTGCFPSEKLAGGAEGDWIAGCVQMDPKDRFSTMEEVLAALEPESGEHLPAEYGDDAYLKSYLPPGFRTHAPSKMIPAAIGYIFVAAALLTSDYGAKGAFNWIYRVVLLIMFLVAVFVSGNYRNVLGYLHIAYIEKPMVRWLTVFLLDMGIICTGVVLVMLFDIYLPRG